MAIPLRKDLPEDYPGEKQLTTADIAHPHVNDEAQGRKPIAVDRNFDRIAETNQPSVRTEPLFAEEELGGLRDRWKAIQTNFVDEPRVAVEQADGLVASAMKRLAEVFSEERAKLEQQWVRGDDVSTEDLRIALQRYRTFFERLLSV